jgi:hypothetical protein
VRRLLIPVDLGGSFRVHVYIGIDPDHPQAHLPAGDTAKTITDAPAALGRLLEQARAHMDVAAMFL